MADELDAQVLTPDVRSARLGLLARVLGSVGGGLLLVLSFPPFDLVWLAPPALAILTLSWHGVRARRGFWLGYLGGAAFLLWHLTWMRVIGDDAWLMLGLVFALYWGLVGAGVASTSRLRLWPLAAPLMWVLSEALRGRVPLGGFPWGNLAFGQTSTTLTPYAALGGAPLVTFAIALVGQGARVLAVQTNNATYGGTGQLEQQMAMSRLRAIEHGRVMLIAATSGISAIVRPDGTLAGTIPEGAAGYLVERIPLRDTLTVADRLGALPEYAAGLTALVLIVVAGLGRRRARPIGSETNLSPEESVL